MAGKPERAMVIMMTDKWMPVVGQECEYLIRGEEQWTKCIYIGESSCNFPVIEKSNGDITEACYANFRPIQTDKYREEQIFNLDIALHMKQTVSGQDLYNAGCRVLAPDERIVKPLTDGQKTALKFEYTGSILMLIDAVQRELGVID